MIRPATPADIPGASAVMTAAAQWLIDRGLWLWDLDEVSVDATTKFVEAGELHVALQGTEIVGTFVIQGQDPEVWPHAKPGEAMYVHRLAVARHVAGTGVSTALLNAAADVARAAGCPFLRLDASSGHPPLVPFYQRHGFQPRGMARFPNGQNVMRLELPLNDADQAR